jgi:hypothetical protein
VTAEAHVHVLVPVENRGGRVIARRCSLCGYVEDVHGQRVITEEPASENPWEPVTIKCQWGGCGREFLIAAVYAPRTKWCRDRTCKGRAAYDRRKKP